jgi:hypothetical protein
MATVSAQKHEAERSPKWNRFRDDFVSKNPGCVVCGRGKEDGVGVQAHHIFPFHYCIALGRPDLELDARNLITLCETEAGHSADNHHLLVGHLDDFESSNLSVVADASGTFKGQGADQIRANAKWLTERKGKLPHILAMTPEDKAAFTWAMNTRYPKAESPAGPKPPSLPAWIPKLP